MARNKIQQKPTEFGGESIVYLDRKTGKRETEAVYGEKALRFLYGNDLLSRLLGAPFLHFSARYPIFSALYGAWQKMRWSRKKIVPFIRRFGVNAHEFKKEVEDFSSFNDFFIRKLKPDARPIAPGDDVAIIPADGRYLVYPHIGKAEGFVVKGEKFDLGKLLEDDTLASEYTEGGMVIGRLCPSDYHRYHFPCDCTPDTTRFINGWLNSVNPMAVRKNVHIFTQNKRAICQLETERFGKVLFIEIGATSVGSIHQTYQPNVKAQKGDEKGYFSFGASSLILLFPPNAIIFDEDLLEASQRHLEIKCLMGMQMGLATTNLGHQA